MAATDIARIIAELEGQKAAIDEALDALRQLGGQAPARSGRPPGQKNASPAAAKQRRGGKRVLSPEGKQRIAEAARRRWAAQRQARAEG